MTGCPGHEEGGSAPHLASQHVEAHEGDAPGRDRLDGSVVELEVVREVELREARHLGEGPRGDAGGREADLRASREREGPQRVAERQEAGDGAPPDARPLEPQDPQVVRDGLREPAEVRDALAPPQVELRDAAGDARERLPADAVQHAGAEVPQERQPRELEDREAAEGRAGVELQALEGDEAREVLHACVCDVDAACHVEGRQSQDSPERLEAGVRCRRRTRGGQGEVSVGTRETEDEGKGRSRKRIGAQDA